MRKFYILLLTLGCIYSNLSFSQVSTYLFSQSSGTYAPITGGTQIARATGTSGATGLDDVNYPATIPFSFTFNGVAYTSVNINTNGHITFGATLPAAANYTPISSTTAYSGAVSAMGADLRGVFSTTADRTTGSNDLTNVANTTGMSVGDAISGTGIPTGTTITAISGTTITMSAAATSTGTATQIVVGTGEIRVETIGTAPNRTFVIQWKNFQRFGSNNSSLNFQIRLNEAGGVAANQNVEIVYGDVLQTTSTTVQVGLRGATNADFNNRTTTTDWTNSTPGATNTASMTLSSTVFPPSGLTYTFTPSSCFPPTGLTATNITMTSADVSWTPPSSGTPTGYEYAVTTSATPPASGTATTGTSASVGSLSPGTLYYLHVRTNCSGAFSNWATISFGTLSGNDDCATAVSLTVNSGTACTSVTAGSTVGATQSAPACVGTGADDDVWFSFVATNVAHSVSLRNVTAASGTSVDMVHQVYSGACGTLTSIKCSDPDSSVVTGLTVGATYFVRVHTYFATSRTNFNICISTPPPAPANDECDGAITITPEAAGAACAASVSANTTNALQSTPDPSCTSTSNNDDIWYSFTAVTTAYQVRFSNMLATTGTATALGFAVYSGTCSGLTQLYCIASFGTAGAGISAAFGGLIPGNVYYLRLFTAGTGNSATFDFCVQEAPTPPANDDCINAINVVPEAAGASCAASTAASTTNATQSSPNPSCTSINNNDDIWYTFTATTSTYRVRFSGMVATFGTATTLGLAVYSGTCGSLAEINCQAAFGATGSGLSSPFNVTPGTTYYLRLFTGGSANSANFNFCIQESPTPPVNDECTGALSITTQPPGSTCATSTLANTTNATQSTNAASCTSTATNDDLWYTFTAGSTSQTLRFSNMVATSGTATALGYAVYSGSCGTLTEVDCDATFGTGGAGSQNITGLTIGTVYYLRLFTAGINNSATFDFCLQNVPPPPANDECAGATSMPVTSAGASCTFTAVNTTGATQSTVTGQPNTCTSTGIDDDVFYTFTTTIAGTYTFSYTGLTATSGTASTVGMNVYTGSCPPTSSLTEVALACSSGFGTGGAGSRTLTLAANTTYTLRLYVGSSPNSGTFNFCITAPTPPPANDECTGAIALPTPSSTTTCNNAIAGTTNGATQSGTPAPSCNATGINDDVWYSFVATGDRHTVLISNETSATAAVIYSGTCAALVQVANSCGTGAATANGLTVGATYYVRVFTTTSTPTTFSNFDICVISAPANDECTGAVALPTPSSTTTCNNAIGGNTVGATQSADAAPSCNATGINDDVWYSFVATSAKHAVLISNASTTMGAAIYTGSCGSLTQVAAACGATSGGDGTVPATGLTVGTTYYVRVFTTSATVGTTGTFDICIISSPANDDCNGAASLSVSSSNTCSSSTSGTTAGATPSTETVPSCNPLGVNDDVWYSFVATGTTHTVLLTNASSTTAAAVYSGSCGGLTQVANACGSTLSGNGEILASGLTTGTTYYVRVFTTVSTVGAFGTFDICIISAPANDNCSGAEALTVSTNNFCTSPTAGSTAGATQSTEAATTCSNTGTNDDVWYSFVATAASHTVSLTNTSTTTAFAVYSGSCGALTQVGCASTNGVVAGLTPGTTYYVRVYTTSTTVGTSTTFNICIGALPTNDECTNAISLTASSTCNPTPGSTVGATASTTLPAPTCSASGANDDVWYSFSAAATSHIVSLTNTSTTTAAAVYSGTCGGLTQIACASTTVPLTGLTIGTTYYVRVYSTVSTVGTFSTFDICITAPPANDDCTTAASLTINAPPVQGTTLGATQSLAGCIGTADDDVFYSFVANSASATITVAGASSFDAVVQAFDACGGTSLGCIDATNAGQQEVLSLNNLTSGNTYYFRVYHWAGTASSTPTFNVSVISGALPVTISTLSGQRNGNANQLKWTTATEQNNRGFYVERSADGRTYSSIGFVASQATGGYSNSVITYSFADNNISGDRHYYRLRQVDLDGKEKLSNIVLIRGVKTSVFIVSGLFPNPATSKVNVMIDAPSKDNITLFVTDISGKIVRQQKAMVESGSNTIEMEIDNLASGTYMVKMVSQTNGETSVIKFVKQ